MVQESSKPLGLTLSEAEIEAAGHRVRAWRNTYGSMRRELRVRLASWIAEDLAGLSSTRPPRRGSLFVTPGKTSHPDPEVGLLRESLAEPERRWLFEHPFKAPRHASYYAGSYSLRLDELPEARASLGEFLALEEQLLTAIRQLQDEFEAALSSR